VIAKGLAKSASYVKDPDFTGDPTKGGAFHAFKPSPEAAQFTMGKIVFERESRSGVEFSIQPPQFIVGEAGIQRPMTALSAPLKGEFSGIAKPVVIKTEIRV
jgi:hypothetical protein